MNSLAHIEMNVSDISIAKQFYDVILGKLGWESFIIDENVIGYKAKDQTHLFFVQTAQTYLSDTFHRKHTGLNHIAFRVESKEEVDGFCSFLKEQDIKTLYNDGAGDYAHEYDMKEYYAVFFEDPDRIKLEIVYMK